MDGWMDKKNMKKLIDGWWMDRKKEKIDGWLDGQKKIYGKNGWLDG